MSNPQYAYLTETLFGKIDHNPDDAPLIIDFLNRLETHPPEAVLIFSGFEVEVSYIFRNVLPKLQNWCIKNNKKVYVFSPCQEYSAIGPNGLKGSPCSINDIYSCVEWHEWHGFDIILAGINERRIAEKINPALRLRNPDYQEIPMGLELKPSKLFTCYNNRPSEHRHKLIDELAKHDLLNKGIVTYRHYMEIMPIEHPDATPPLETFNYYNGDPKLIDEEDFVLHIGNYNCHNYPKSYFKGAIDIVTESRYEPGEYYMSEKTNKPLLAKKPFLVLGPQGYHKWLQETKGIEMYDEIFDYGFDDEPLLEHRIEGIVQNIRLLDGKELDYILKITNTKCEKNLCAYQTISHDGDTTHINMLNFLNTLELNDLSFVNHPDEFTSGVVTHHGRCHRRKRRALWSQRKIVP